MPSKHLKSTATKNTGITRVFKAFSYSMSGIASAFKNEAAFREEAILACLMVPFSLFFNISVVEHLVLIGSVILVLIVELLNSCIEAAVDDVSLERRPLAKQAKDMGSAAVFFSLLNCGICWVFVVVSNWSGLLG